MKRCGKWLAVALALLLAIVPWANAEAVDAADFALEDDGAQAVESADEAICAAIESAVEEIELDLGDDDPADAAVTQEMPEIAMTEDEPGILGQDIPDPAAQPDEVTVDPEVEPAMVSGPLMATGEVVPADAPAEILDMPTGQESTSDKALAVASEPVKDAAVEIVPGDEATLEKAKSGPNATRVPVLTYHKVLANDVKKSKKYAKDRFSVSVSTFSRQMKWLKKKHYTAITCEQLYLWRINKIKLPRRSVLITLDDGDAATIENVIPVLEENGLRATSFIIGRKSYRSNGTGAISLARIRELQEQCQCIEFQSHTWNLHKKNAYRRSYASFKADAEKQKQTYGFKYLAYPYGRNSKAMIKAYRKSGIRMAFTFGSSKDGYATKQQSLLKTKRIEVKASMSMRKFRKWCS